MTNYIIYTEILEDGGIDRWFYGMYADRTRANEIALQLGGEYPVYHCVCTMEMAKTLKVQNLPF